jgi:hypothetical protein
MVAIPRPAVARNQRPALMTKLPNRMPAAEAATLTVREKMALFCAAADIDHGAVGIPAHTMQALEIRGLIEREHAADYALSDKGRAVLRAMLGEL